MLKKYITLIFILLIHFKWFNLNAQKTQVLIKSIEDLNNKLIIKYDFADSKESQRFNVTLDITSSTGQIIHANSLSGDLGNRIKGGTNKEISWDYVADGIVMNGNLNFEVIAILTSANQNIAKSLLLSTAWPGLGMTRVDKKKPYWIMGIAGYGCIGASVYLNKKSNDNYTTYLNNNIDSENDNLFNKSQSLNTLSKSLAYTAIGIWGINLIWTTIIINRKNKADIGFFNNQNLLFYSVYDPVTKIKGFSLKFNF
jgi:hypothetical protein